MRCSWINDIHSFNVYLLPIFSFLFTFPFLICTVKWIRIQIHLRWIHSRFEWLDSIFCSRYPMIKTVNFVIFPILSILVKYCILTDVWFLGEVEHLIIIFFYFVFLYFVHSSHLAHIKKKEKEKTKNKMSTVFLAIENVDNFIQWMNMNLMELKCFSSWFFPLIFVLRINNIHLLDFIKFDLFLDICLYEQWEFFFIFWFFVSSIRRILFEEKKKPNLRYLLFITV